MQLKVAEISDRLAEKRVHIKVTEKAVDQIIEQSFDPQYGARPIKRFIQSNIETLIARMMIEKDIEPESQSIGKTADLPSMSCRRSRNKYKKLTAEPPGLLKIGRFFFVSFFTDFTVKSQKKQTYFAVFWYRLAKNCIFLTNF